MRADVVLAGVGGQGVITIGRLLAEAAHRGGWNVVQGELHGMSQRGGAVHAQVRISDVPVESPQVPRGGADLLIGVEPVEALRHLSWLRPGGRLLVATQPVENVPDYPPLEDVLAALRRVPGAILLDACELARSVGAQRGDNLVLAGAAAALLPIDLEHARESVAARTARWSAKDRETAERAFAAGLAAVSEADVARTATHEAVTAGRARLEALFAGARDAGRAQLLEHEALAVVEAMGFAVPRHATLPEADAAGDLDLAAFSGRRVVVKALSPTLAHKTEAGGVAVVARTREAVAGAVREMRRRLGDALGFLVAEWVPHDSEPGGELLLGLRWSRELGPLVTLALGGVTAEALARTQRPGEGPLVFAPGLHAPGAVERALGGRTLGSLAAGTLRGRAARAGLGELAGAVERLLAFAAWGVPEPVAELEINPLVFAKGRAWALDALVRLGRADPPDPPRPLERAARLLRPRTVAVMGVSARGENPARIILRNTLAAGFPAGRLTVIKPGARAIDGVACVPDLVALPAPVDMLVLAIPAHEVPAALREVVETRCAEGVVLIPGGLGEREGTAGLAAEVRADLHRARREPAWTGPVVNGANCLGLRSLPGRVDTLFIPHAKLPLPAPGAAPPMPVALLSQSGAFAIARMSKLPWLTPREVVTVGNQIDLTVADWLDVLADDPDLRVIACYVEGFRTLDGLRFARRVAALAAEGRLVILYRAGRTREGAAASASHTASLAGDPLAARELIGAAGALVADGLEEFEDLLSLAARLHDRRVDGTQLGVVSNAGFECVAVADNLGPLRLAELAPATRGRLERLFAEARLDGFLDVHHPLDVTPIADDAAFAAAARSLADPSVDVGLVGCVPLTSRLATLRAEVGAAEAVGARLVELWRRTERAWVAVVDSGPLYDPLAATLEAGGVPTFRSADRAVRALGRYASWRVAHGRG